MSLSIIIPTFNRALLIQECLRSCMEFQGGAELVVVDDCSTDTTKEVLDTFIPKLAARGITLRVFYLDRNQGAPACRNLGLKHSQGKYVMFLDSDDVLNAKGVQAGIAKLEQFAVDFVYGQVQLTDADLQPLPGRIVGSQYGEGTCDLAGYHWHTMGAIYRRELLDRVGWWNGEIKGADDWEFQARVKLHAESRLFLNELFGLWRHHTGDRLAALSFRVGYVESVVIACLSIARQAQGQHRYDRSLANKIANRMFRHGLEFSTHGYPKEACWVFHAVKQLPDISPLHRLAMSVWQFSPRFVNRMLYRLICATH